MTAWMFLILLAAIVTGICMVHAVVSKTKDKVDHILGILQEEIRQRNQR
jgi:hypothetical protein